MYECGLLTYILPTNRPSQPCPTPLNPTLSLPSRPAERPLCLVQGAPARAKTRKVSFRQARRQPA